MNHAELPEAVRRLYPWPGRDLVLESGHRLHYVDEGQGETLLLVHGNPSWSFHFRALVQAFSATHRVVVVDHLGCGLSDKPQDWPYTLAGHTANLEELVLRLDLRDLTLVAHDWGGAIGTGVVLRHPERFRRLMYMNTALFMGALPWRIALCRWPGIGGLVVRGLNGFVGPAPKMCAAKPMPPEAAQGYLAPYGSWADRVAVHGFVLDIPLEPDHPTRPVVEELDRRSGELSAFPVLIVWGEQDFVFTAKYLEGWRARLPNAEIHTVPDAAHYVLEDAPEVVIARLRDFLARHPLKSEVG